MFTIEGITINNKRERIEINEKSGLILKVGEPTGQADVVLKNEIIFPGFIDIHVHARECTDHSQDYKEDFKTAGEAALNGGVVSFCDMPNNPIPPIDDKSYAEKKELAKKCEAEVLLYAGIGPGTKPLFSSVPYKAFMGPSIGELFFRSKDELENTIKFYAGQNVSFHCEDPEILEENKNQPTHELQRPAEAENSAVDFAISLIKKYNLQGKICHSSTLVALGKIVDAKRKGVSVTVEITPHHLYYDQSMITEENKNWLRMNPPLRKSKEDRLKMIQMLQSGEIDYLATDHAPHTIEEKKEGISGMPHLDTYGPFVTWLIREHNFTYREASRVCSVNPANFVNQFLSSKYGKIEPDHMGSLTVIDMNQPITITKEMLKTKCAWSPFEGVTFPGRVAMTIIKGKVFKNL